MVQSCWIPRFLEPIPRFSQQLLQSSCAPAPSFAALAPSRDYPPARWLAHFFQDVFGGLLGKIKCEKNMFGNKHANPESLLEHCTWFSSFQFGSVYLRTMPSMCAIPTTQTVLQRGSNIRRVGQWILQFPIVAPCRLFWKSFHELLEQLEGPKVWTSNNQRQNNQPVLSEVNVLERKSCVMWASRACKSALAKPWCRYSEVGEWSVRSLCIRSIKLGFAQGVPKKEYIIIHIHTYSL